MKRWTWVLGLVVAAGVATALAQQPGGPGGGRPPSPVIEALDADHDGVISTVELKNAANALSKLDKNKDGKLTDEEFRPQGGRPGQEGPGGGHSGGEGPGGGAGAGRGEQGRRPDAAGGQGNPGRGPGGGQRGPGGQGGPPPAPDPERMLSHAMEFDADNDGKLSKSELHKFIDDFIKHHPGPGGGGPRGGAGGPPNAPGSGSRPDEGGERPERPKRPE